MSLGRGSVKKRKRIKQALSAEETVCWLCLEPLDFSITDWRNTDFVVIDEYIPVSKGGDPLDKENCHLTHNKCNARKGDRILPKGYFSKYFIQQQMKPKSSRKWI